MQVMVTIVRYRANNQAKPKVGLTMFELELELGRTITFLIRWKLDFFFKRSLSKQSFDQSRSFENGVGSCLR